VKEKEDVGAFAGVFLVELFDAFLRQPQEFLIGRHDLLWRIRKIGEQGEM
jgi:hypothetical protein